MKRRRSTDLQPPPQPLFRHQYHHHHNLRYEHVLLHPPNFIPRNHFPPPPPPQLHQPPILLLPPPLHIAHPPRFNQSPHISHPYDIGLLSNPYLNRNYLPPPPPPQENIDRQFQRGENNRGRDNDCGRVLNDENRCDRVTKKMDYDVTRRGSIDGWIRGLYKDKDDGNDEDKDRDYDERRKGSCASEGQFVRSYKKKKLQKESAMSRVQSGKDNCRVDEESSSGSLRGKEKEGPDCLQTRMDDKKDKKASNAVLAPPCPDDVKADINSTIVETGVTSSMPGSPTTDKSVKDVGKTDHLANDALDKTKELSEAGIVADEANGSGVFAVEEQPQEDMELQQGPTVVESGSTRRNRLKRERKARKKLLCKTDTQKGSDDVINVKKDCIIPLASPPPQPSNDCIIPLASPPPQPSNGCIIPLASPPPQPSNGCIVPLASPPPQPCFDAYDLVEIAVENQFQKDKNLHSPIVRASQSARRKKWKARKKLLLETSLQMRNQIANVKNDCNQHGDDVDKVAPKEISVFDTEKIKIESVAQYAEMGTDRVDDFAGSSQEGRCSSQIHASSECDSALLLKLENENISIVGPADANSKEVLLHELNTPQVVGHSEEITSPESVTVLDYSSETSTSAGFLAADHIFSPNALSNKPSFGDIGPVEGSVEAVSDFLSVDNSPIINKKRKGSGEVERILAKVLVPALEVEFLGEKGSFKEVDKSNRGLSGVEDPTLELDSDANGFFPSNTKKRKVSSPRSNLSSFLEDEMVADVLSGDCPKTCQVSLSTGPAEWEAEKRENLSFSRNTSQLENDMICGGENITNRKPVSTDFYSVPSEKSLPKAALDNSQINDKLSRSLPEANREVVKKPSLVQVKHTLSKNQLISASPKVFPGHHPFHFSNTKKPQAANVVKPRTWHRTGNSCVAVAETKSQPSPFPPQSHGIKTVQTFRGSYVRKGNSLVRNPAPSAVKSGLHSGSVYRLNPSAGSLKTNQPFDTQVTSVMRTQLGNTSETPCKSMDASEERMKSPGVVSECRADSGNITSPNTLEEGNSEKKIIYVKRRSNQLVAASKSMDASEERMKSPGVVSECRADSGNITSPNTLEEGNSEKKIIYVKRRSNQLVAASKTDDVPVLRVEKSLASSSDGYYKSNKNQLVRASSENPVKKRDGNGNSRRLVPRTTLPRTCTKRPSKFSFVWKLRDLHSSEKEKASVRPQRILPHVVPWKRTPCWRSFMHALSTKQNKSSFSIASQSLMLSRKRGAIYTRSTHGYSLKMSKVLSVGGSSLKWSKSIERNLKKSDEEATRAVAAGGGRKKEENGAKSRNNVSRERIFRIGSERYKMDSSRRTLHRIAAEQEPPSSVVVQSEKKVKRSYVPRRLLIGNEEYVRIGNGNQLVRDPKKRTRVLASEKVRWSLRTARLRLARKGKYCQFFTRFGKCNKDDGKCPYIHDSTKIAVCTKFLNGLCTNADCKLTHKVIPERMEDCSYFLKGSCSNEKCHYRHVNVKPESGVCNNFLKGYCADGNECLKKHTYVCPSFEATGSCPKASMCKLHHPKKKIEKKQPAIEQKIVKGRYFDGGLIGDADINDTSADVVSSKGNDDVVSRDGKFPDFISLNVSDEEYEEDSDDTDDDMVSDDFDVLV